MFPLKRAVCSARCFHPNARHMSAQGPLVDLTIDNKGIATLTMQRPPVNSLNLELLQEMSTALDDVGKNKAGAMMLTSSVPTIFSAGLDIMEMYKPDLQRAELFWTTLQDVWLKLFGSKFITAAAINGHAPAGGCFFAMSCEYRAMVNGSYIIGMNETALGMAVPSFVVDSMKNTISVRETEIGLTSAKLFTVDEALKIGLIDATATDKADAVEKCKQFIKRFDRIPPYARGMTKLSLREAALKRLIKNRKQETDIFLEFLKTQQQGIGMYAENLKNKSERN